MREQVPEGLVVSVSDWVREAVGVKECLAVVVGVRERDELMVVVQETVPKGVRDGVAVLVACGFGRSEAWVRVTAPRLREHDGHCGRVWQLQESPTAPPAGNEWRTDVHRQRRTVPVGGPRAAVRWCGD